MKYRACVLPLLSGVLLFSASAFAGKGERTSGVDSIDIYYTATVYAPTCQMTLDGPQVIDNGSDSYTLTIGDSAGKVTLEQVRNDQATSNFRIMAVDDANRLCSRGVENISMTLSGSASTDGTLLLNNSGGSTKAGNIGVGFYLRDDSAKKKIRLNTEDVYTSTLAELGYQGVWLTAILQEIASGQGTQGEFSALATFTFSFE
ncbi:TPA: fimbrial protein [Citrobacter freundii]|nr:fimbrial protein [Citrobacter freundii]